MAETLTTMQEMRGRAVIHDEPLRELARTDRELIATLHKQLARCNRWSYGPEGASATEPAALAAIALLAHGDTQAAQQPLSFLRRMQRPDGTVPSGSEADAAPWTTAWAVLAWAVAVQLEPVRASDCRTSLERGVEALRNLRGVPVHSDEPLVKHNRRLTGWSWVPGTHSWVEPTALSVLALTAAGQAHTARVQEGLQLLLDRQLSCGGWNYGNTVVLNHELRPHVQPSGMAAAALVAAGPALEAVRRACHFLESQIASCTSAASFSWCWLGLAAHGQDPTAACRWQWQKVATGSSTTPRGPYHWALLLWAAAGRENCAWHVIRQRLSKTPRPVSSSLPNLPAAHAHTEPPASPSIH